MIARTRASTVLRQSPSDLIFASIDLPAPPLLMPPVFAVVAFFMSAIDCPRRSLDLYSNPAGRILRQLAQPRKIPIAQLRCLIAAAIDMQQCVSALPLCSAN
jgi:hypothetical protein